MIEIIIAIVALIAIFMMARKGGTWRKNRARRGYRKLPIDAEVLGGTVGANDVTSTLFTAVMTEERLVSTVRGTWTWENVTVGDGPIVVGLAHGDYTAAEIEECLEALGAWDEGDKVAQEQANRLVRQIGTFGDGTVQQELNDGKPITTRLNWRIATGDTLQLFIWNKGEVLSTGSSVNFQGHLNSWRR